MPALFALIAAAVLAPSVRGGTAPAETRPGPLLRVGLVRKLAAARSIDVQVPPGSVLEGGGVHCAAPGSESWRFTASSDGNTVRADLCASIVSGRVMRVVPPPSSDPLAVRTGDRGAAQRYRGVLEVRAAGDRAGLLVINEVPLETYLRGVLAPEMGEGAPAEALKAQAVAARTHAWKSRGRYARQPYDVQDTTSTQVYGGVGAERTTTDAAVRDTCGLVLAVGGRLVWGDYYEDCGGVTSPGSSAMDYPPSVVDRPEAGGPDYCARSRSHTWTLRMTAAALAAALPAAMQVRIGTPLAIRVDAADVSGRVTRVAIAGTLAEAPASGSELRRWVGYARMLSTLFTVQTAADGAFEFQGRGNGHGHGMCQEGAIAMASPPYGATFEQILAHYYPGSSLVQLDTLVPPVARAGSR